MEGGLLGDTFDVKKEGRGEVDYPFAINGVVSVSCIDRFLQSCGGEGLFPDKSPVKARDACAAINKGMGVNSF